MARRRKHKYEETVADHIIPTSKKTTFTETMNRTMATTSKQLIWLFSINSIAWVWCSYVLAFMGKDQIAESLSSNICTVIIGQLIVYFISKTVENIFRWNPKFGGQSEYPADQINNHTIKVEMDDTTGADDISNDVPEPEDAGTVVTGNPKEFDLDMDFGGIFK